jgi:hypothetical protein
MASTHRPLVHLRDLPRSSVITGQAAGPCSSHDAGLVQARWDAVRGCPSPCAYVYALTALLTDLLWLL